MKQKVVSGGLTPFTLNAYATRGMNGDYAKVTISDYSQDYRVAVTVLDSHGNPQPGIQVTSKSYSGRAGEHITDSNGFALINPGEIEVLALYADDIEVWKSPYQGWVEYFFGTSCARGLAFQL
jgi:hypothetical protein